MTGMVGYLRVSTREQAEHGYGLAAQREAITSRLAVESWEADEGSSGKTLDRPGLRRALERIATGEADGLVVAKLDRLTRSVMDFAIVLEWFRVADATLIALDLGVDTGTPGGRLVANVMASVAEWERETIAQRTRDGLAQARLEGRPVSGPSVRDDSELAERIRALREQGFSYRAICGVLNEERVPTVRGGMCWRPSAVAGVLGAERRPSRRARVELPEAR